MLQIKPLNQMNLIELETELGNKEKAANDLNVWLSRHDNKEPEYRHVWDDRTELEKDIAKLKAEIIIRKKPFAKSLNESLEL